MVILSFWNNNGHSLVVITSQHIESCQSLSIKATSFFVLESMLSRKYMIKQEIAYTNYAMTIHRYYYINQTYHIT